MSSRCCASAWVDAKESRRSFDLAMMSPRPKRARTKTNEDISMDGHADTDASSKPKPHDTLWFEDGNIVLATDVHLYCVHRGILAKNSSVFKDMLSLPCVAGMVNGMDGANGESWEGKPLVKMVGDSDENVYHLLMALYDLKCVKISLNEIIINQRESFELQILQRPQAHDSPNHHIATPHEHEVRHPCNPQRSHKSSCTNLSQRTLFYDIEGHGASYSSTLNIRL